MTTIEDQPEPVPYEVGKPSILALVRADLTTREQLGIERYGTTLQPDNGRDSLVDAYQEALDMAAYLRQRIEEGGTVSRHGADDTPREPSMDDATPGHILAAILDGDTARRLEICKKAMADARATYECYSYDHRGRIEELQRKVRELSKALVRSMSGIPVLASSDVAAYAEMEANRD